MEYFVCIFLISIISCDCQQINTANIATNGTAKDIMFYEYGAHIDGEELSFVFDGLMPAFTPIYKLNVTPSRHDVEKRFTYLRTEYISPMSKVSIGYDPKTYLLTFHIKFPFIDIPIGVIGFSMSNKMKN
ncbi:hypothetical protein K1T71_010782 [Dendrolimus kikuchii]|uniref:Uncharacterized protein n=1 Tax=Dendrolimus kikuchii TaxID=765133 RepID=A0ACC1CPX0_9NEOP|nr:hypothetical protein K1T71_010782 [Dendrolimus kikuchii]